MSRLNFDELTIDDISIFAAHILLENFHYEGLDRCHELIDPVRKIIATSKRHPAEVIKELNLDSNVLCHYLVYFNRLLHWDPDVGSDYAYVLPLARAVLEEYLKKCDEKLFKKYEEYFEGVLEGRRRRKSN